MHDIKEFHNACYSIPEKCKEDAFILKYCCTKAPKSGNVVVKREMAYNLGTGMEIPISKRDCTPEEIISPDIPIGVPLKTEKVSDVDKLLTKHFGINWRSLPNLE